MELKSFIELAGGLVLLLGGGHYLVSGGVCLARRLNVSTLVVGLTVVSLGTSAPELLVSMHAAFTGHPDISVGNVVGSNISNIGLVLGLSSLIFPLVVRSSSIKFDWPVMMIAGILLYWFGYDREINHWEGLIFVSALVLFIIYSFVKAGKDEKIIPGVQVKYKMSLPLAIFTILASSAALMYGAKLLVRGATDIAQFYQVSERAISLTVIAVGTSLPELATSVVAAFKREPDISIGNIIGSNIYNTFGILGLTALIKPITNISRDILKDDIFWMLGFFVLLFLFILPFKGGKISRVKGIVFLLLYGVYIYMVFN